MMQRSLLFIRRCWDDVHILQVLGPVFLSLSFLVARGSNAEIFFTALLGVLLCIRGGARGCSYALALLGLVAIAKHAWMSEGHLQQLGFEASVGAALIVTTLAFQLSSQVRDASESALATKIQTISNMEDELTLQRDEANRERACLLEKLQEIRQTLEETQAESSSLQVLNEVLRQASAKSANENEARGREVIQSQRRIGDLFEEIDALQKELHRIGTESVLVEQNRQLFKELNAARVLSAQTQLSSETSSRTAAEKTARCEALESELSAARVELEMAENHVEKLMEQIHLSGNGAQEIERLSEERNFLSTRLALLQEELEVKRSEPLGSTAVAPQSPVPEAKSPSHIEQLYNQLRVQFEEKGNLLHQVRAELFRADTELQTLRREGEQKGLEAELVVPAVQQVLDALEEERQGLVKDNSLLEELVSHLMAVQPPAVKRAGNLPAEQGQLF